MAVLATQQVTRGGLNPVMSAVAGGGDSFQPGDKAWLRIDNADSASHTVTIHVTATRFGRAVADLVVAVPAGQTRMIGPLINEEFLDPATNLGSMTYTSATGMTAGVFTL